MNQFEQLLTCAICLDRYRNPKLLPCQHSFCMEPCMDGLVDYVRRQVKCPECRAEHRIPYQGVQAFPTNVTLKRFLDLHIEITGELPDPTSGQIMERCTVCSEKAYLTPCQHCDKKICPECKGAHMDILRREIVRINNQIRRGLHKLQDSLQMVEKNTTNLQSNCASVNEEIDEINRRLSKALKDRTDYLRNEVDRYIGGELRTLRTLKDNLQLEIANIQSNCDLADKHMTERVDWDDSELMDAKEIFLKTVEFIRNFEMESNDYIRRIRFIMTHDPNQLVLHVAGYGELNINQVQPQGLAPTTNPGLMRSKSDHRLAFRQEEDEGRKFGFRRPTDEYEYEERPVRSRYRSRLNPNQDPEPESRNVRFDPPKERERVLDTEDVARGPLSGISRLLDSPRVMQRLQESEVKKKEVPKPQPPVVRKTTPVVQAAPPSPAVRQVSEDDEITKIKRLNKGAGSSTDPVETQRPQVDRVAALKSQVSQREPESDDSRRSGTPRKTPSLTSDADSDESVSSHQQQQRHVTPTAKRSDSHKSRSASSESTTSSDSSSSAVTSRTPVPEPVKKPEPRFVNRTPEVTPKEETEESSSEEETESEDETKTDIGPLLARSAQARESSAESSRKNSRDETKYRGEPKVEEPPKYQSRFLNKSRSSAVVPPEEDESRYPSGRSRYMAMKDRRSRLARSKSSHNFNGDEDEDDSTINPNAYLASRGYGSATNDLSRSRSSHALKSRENSPERATTTTEKDGAALSSWARYLKNKYGNRKEETPRTSSTASTTTPSRRLSLGIRHESSDDDSKNMQGSLTTPPTAGIVAVQAAGTSPRSQYLQKRKQLFKIGMRGSEPGCFTWPRGIAVGPDNTIVVADSSNHRVQVFDANGGFITEFGQYGNGEGEFDCLAGVAVNRIGQYIIADRYNHRIQVFDPAGRFLRAFGSQGTSDGRFNYPWGITTDALGFIYVCDKENHRVQVFQSDGTFVGKFGSIGNKTGQLEHPHYIAVSNTNRVIVSDSNNHRVQVFDVNGRVVFAFGAEGSEEGQFKFPKGVAVDDQGYIFVADSGNNRIQIFTSDGSFLRAFGCWGAGEAEFKGLEGVAVMSNGNILVCDRENHRVQAF